MNRKFKLGNDTIEVEISDTEKHFKWRMKVNNTEWSQWGSQYNGVFEHRGYHLTTSYFGGIFPDFVPFRIQAAEEIK